MDSIHTAKRKRFTGGGAGVFTCGVCKRRTRETNGDHAQTELCEPCYELSGIENAISDRGDEAIAEYRDEALQWIAKLEKLGGDVSSWADMKAQLTVAFDPLQMDGPTAPPTVDDIRALCTEDEAKIYDLLMSRGPSTYEMERADIKRLTGLGEERCYNVLRKMVADGKLVQRMHTGKRDVGWQTTRPVRVARYSIA